VRHRVRSGRRQHPSRAASPTARTVASAAAHRARRRLVCPRLVCPRLVCPRLVWPRARPRVRQRPLPPRRQARGLRRLASPAFRPARRAARRTAGVARRLAQSATGMRRGPPRPRPVRLHRPPSRQYRPSRRRSPPRRRRGRARFRRVLAPRSRAGRSRLPRGLEAGQADGPEAARVRGPGRGQATIRSVPRRPAWARHGPLRRRVRPRRALGRKAAHRRVPARTAPGRVLARRGQVRPAQASRLAAWALRAVAGRRAAFRVPPQAAAPALAGHRHRACPGPAALVLAR